VYIIHYFRLAGSVASADLITVWEVKV